MRYALLGLLELVVLISILFLVRRSLDMPGWLLWSLVAGWIIKDVVLFPFVWRAYDAEGTRTADAMIGACGIARDRLDPAGYVRVRGELWKAEREEDGPPIEAGCRVRVRRREGLTLFVTPEEVSRRIGARR